MSQQQQQMVMQQQQSSSSSSSSSSVSQSTVSTQQVQVQQVQQVQQNAVREVRQGVQMVQGPTQVVPLGLPPGASPPVFEQIFRNARFAQGGDALFEGKVTGNPKPNVSWMRKGEEIQSGSKYQVTHDPNSGVVTLLICAIGPGDEGEYTCTAANQFGEAICTVYIQPEAAYMMQQQRQQQQQQSSTQSKQVTVSQQRHMQQQQSISQQQMKMQQSSHMESFKVDTFEYRVLHEVEFRQAITMRMEGEEDVELGAPLQGPPQAPQIQQKPRSTKVGEGANATFGVGVTSNPSSRVSWFKNGERLRSSEKFLMSQSAGQVTLVVKNVSSSDSGYYSMLAENNSGCTVASAQLAAVSRGQEITNGIAPEVVRPDKIVLMEVDDTEDESSKALEPKFTTIPGDREVQEGKMVRFDCRLTGRPYPEVAWLLNGSLIIDDMNHKVLVNEQGNHSLMINETTLKDNGVITCIAKNKSGESNFQCQLHVLEREQVVAPKFVERFQQCQAKEGETVVLQARAVGTPTPVLSWQKDGVSVKSCPAIMIQIEGGASALQVLSASGADAGWYQCTAQNSAGSTATRARLHVQVDPSAQVAPQKPHFPKPTKVIEPEKDPDPEVIYLRHVERSHQQVKGPEEERPTEVPKFTHPLRDINLIEGTSAHFEAKVAPIGDATMNVEWLIDGKPLAASSRATVTYRFGYVALDILNVIKADSGVYTCRAVNTVGQAETSANLRISERPLIESGTQHPEAMEQISYLEDTSRFQRNLSIEEHTNIKPTFVRPLTNLGEINEGKYAHFEAQLHPVSDPFMRIEWFKDGKPITASSRINVIYNFGYVAMNIMHLRQEDSGTYTVRATNKAGECICEGVLKVIPIGTVTGSLGIPEQAHYIKSVEEMESYRLQQSQKTTVETVESTSAPIFNSELKDTKAREGGYAHFEARLEPIGDPSLKVEWYKDGRTIEASSRITTFFNFGYVALTIKALIIQDAGAYSCRAYNSKGEVKVSCNLVILSKNDEEMETQFEDTVLKMQFLEDSSRFQRTEETDTTVSTMPPKFLGPLKGTTKIVEAQKAHFEVRLEPQSDTSMQVEWYFNGHVIMSASRIKFYNDFGYVAMDIADVRSSDSGTYTVIAKNSLGEAQLSINMIVEIRSTIDYSTMHEAAVTKAERHYQESRVDTEEITKTQPVFSLTLQNLKPIPEGKNIHLEARLEPMGDPSMKVEWFFNGRPITIGSRFKTYFDFGYVALDVVGAYTNDSGEYTCRATNSLGSTQTTSIVQVLASGGISSESMNDSAMEQIQMLENSKNRSEMAVEMDTNKPPSFTKPLRNIETIEGTNIHLEARLQPIGDSSMRVEWFFNDQPLKVGHRFRPAYDFDYVALDLLSVYPADSGIYTCRASNKLGETVTSASVKVVAKKDLVFESEHPDSLHKLQYLDDSSRYQRRETMEEVSVKIAPRFLTKMKDVTQSEGQNAHFEAKIEPVTDSNLRVEWYKDGHPILIGSRVRQIHDFGYVALDIRALVPEDSGDYICVATNLMGKDEITAKLSCIKGSSIIMDTQNQTLSMEQLKMLEDKSRFSRTEQIDETTQQTPVFTSSLQNIEILEGQRAHFEVRLIPTSDHTMKIEWFHNEQRVKSGSRFTEYNDFGFVALDIMYAYAEDSGTYTCNATNANGQAITSCTLLCHTKESILLDTMNQDAITKIKSLESSTRTTRIGTVEEATMQAPVFTTPMKDKHIIENAPLHFESRLIPVGDPELTVEWFKNGVPIQQANRISTMHDFGYVALDMKYVFPEDSGTYTCRATNRLGQAVTSATLVVSSKESLLLETQHSEALEKLRYLEDSSRYCKTTTEETIITQAPKFVVQLSGLTTLWEGQSAHVECRLEPYPDPSMKVEWFHNGKPFQIGHRFRTMYDFGFCAMDILSAVAEDSGTYEVKATNKLGSSSSSITIEIKSKGDFIIDSQHPEALSKIARLEQKGGLKRDEASSIIEKPHFGRPLRNLVQTEGQAVHLEATLTPVNDPTMNVEWFFKGTPIKAGHRFRTTYDFGFVALDILYAYPEDTGTYMCRATNGAGQAVTSCNITVEGTNSMLTETMDEQRMRRIQELESEGRTMEQTTEREFKKPIFTSPLTSLDGVVEGERVHLECRLEPINDPDLKVDWFVNGVEIKTGHRFRTTHDFGYVALDILYSYSEDSGTYMCKATNKLGEAVNSCSVTISARRSIYMDTQHPTGWEKIQTMEQRGRYERLEVADLPNISPRFTSELRGLCQLGEGQRAHLEGRIEPIHDPSMRVEWYHNSEILQSASRFHTTFDFGYVALDITSLHPEDSGEYTCRAFNNKGEATSKITFTVEASGNIIYESARPEGLEKIRELEDSSRFNRQVSVDQRTFQRPVFTQPLQNLDNLVEGETAHFECRLIPVGDPNLKVEWYRNEQQIETSSRINRTHDFGYVALDIIGVRPDDEGIYMCRAHNDLGEAVTTASIKVKSHASIQLESQHPEGMRKIQALEDRKPTGRGSEDDKSFDKPVFTSTLIGPATLMESQRGHYECRVVPVGDPTMRFEWFCSGVALKMGSRFHTTSDFGFVTLDILQVIPEDSGVYMCKAYNKAGEAVSSCSTRVLVKDSIIGDTAHPDGWETIKQREAQWNRVPQTPTSPEAMEPPMFTKHLDSFDKLQEGGTVRFEAQVQPANDPYLSIEWYKNGLQLATGTRVRSTFDFGHVTLDICGLRPDDSGIYTCKAVNRVGEAVSTGEMKVFDRDWLIGDSVRPEALPKLARLEEPRGGAPAAADKVYDAPVWVSHLNNVENREGDNAHFECRVEPSKDPTMKIEWFINGKPLPAAARYTNTYDFGFVSLDCKHCYAEDSGIYMVKATNSKGSATTTGTLKCVSKANIYFDTTHPQGQAGLEKVEDAERAFWSKYQRQMSEREASYPKPVFVRPLQANFSIAENQALHMEANVEPKNDPNLKIEWFVNGKPLEQASRYKCTYDFGLVTLDLNDSYDRDQGIYTCKASNKAGEAFTTATVVVSSKDNLIEGTQHPAGDAGMEAILRMEENLRKDDRMLADEEGHAPVFTTEFKSLSNVEEGEIAHFEAMLTPVGDQTMKVEWFYNGEAIKASHRVRTVYAFGMVVLEILGTKVADSGEYTCRASNKWGTADCSLTLEIVDRAHGQPPKFTTHITSVEGLKDGDSAHFECTLVPIGDPIMKVEWFHNGQPLRNATRIKTVCDFGFVVLDIAYLQPHDSGEWMCKASNKYGEDFTKATLNCTGKGGVYSDTLQPGSLDKIAELEASKRMGKNVMSPTAAEPPKFITPIANIERLVEGQSAHFEARLRPVGDPNLTVEWFRDGKKLPTGHRYRTFNDFGIVILDILYCYEEDSGEYEARAVNKLGEDKTTATLKCSSKTGLILTPQVPKGMEGGLQKIQNIEDSAWMRRTSIMSEKGGMAPKFTVPLGNIDNLKEGENAHFEARLVPTDDPRLKVEWYWNGKAMKFSSRIRQFCDFGFVIMELSPVYPEDSGEYMCRAYNDYGEAVTKATLKCEGKRSIILDSQLPKSMQRGMEKIAELEGLMIKSPDMPTPDAGQAPQFISNPHDMTILENQLAHFECRLLPVGDPALQVEWFHNGRPLAAGTRIKTITDFGYVILEIANCYGRDGGTYTCKAVNKFGEASVECNLNITSRSGIILDPQATGRFKNCTDSIQKLEENRWKKEDIVFDEEKPCPPKFVTDLQNITDLVEGQPAHFDCRVEPVGDPSMHIDWFHNGAPLAAGSRVHMMDDFGFVVLDLEWTFARDAGEYDCRATNKWGQCTTSASMLVKSKHSVDLNTQLPQGMTAEKLKELERGPLTEKFDVDIELTPPKFTMLIKSMNIDEGERAFFEARVEPRIDPNLRIEWYHNNKALQSGHRFRTSFEMGHVTLELLHTYAEDSGEYLCRAVNKLGQDITKATLKSKAAQSVVLQSQVPKGMKKIDFATQMEETLSKYCKDVMLTQEDIYDVEKRQPPRFVTHIKELKDVPEMQEAKFECQLAPVGDPNMTVEWFFNGKPLPYKNRFTPIYDFGYVALVMGWVFAEDSGDYVCRATNKYGMDETRAFIKSMGRPGVIYDSQIPKGMASLEKIRELEASWQIAPDSAVEEEKIRTKPEILKKPESLVVQEGDWARFSIRVSGYPKPRVMWIVNGSTAMSGNRFKIWYDGMFHLDIPKTRQYDNGKVEVICRNSLGESYSSCELQVNPRQDDYRAVLKNSPKQHSEGTSKSYRKPDWVVRMEQLKESMQATAVPPQFIQEIVNGRVKEMGTHTFTAIFAGNPKPEIHWYHNDKVLSQTQAIQMRVRQDKAMLTIVDAMPVHKGSYTCRAANNCGEMLSKAVLEIIELTYQEKMTIEHERYAAVQIQQAAEHMKMKERERSDKDKIRHDEAMARMKDESQQRRVEKTREVEEVRTNVWKQQATTKKTKVVEKVEQVVEVIEETYNSPKERCIAHVYRNWKTPIQVEESYPQLEPEEFAPNQVPGVKCFVKVSETSVKGEEVVREIAPQFFDDQMVIDELAEVHTLLKNNVKVNEIWAKFRAGEFKHLQQPGIQTALVKICEFIGHQRNVSIVLAQETQEQASRHPVGLKAFLRMLKHAKDLKPEILFKEVIPKEMGKWSSTTQELEKVSQMLNQGIENEEIIATCEAGKLPTLKKPETQQPLINIVEKQGHSVMVAQVLVEEAYRDAKDEMCVPGFKALVHLATETNIDLETVEFKPLEKKLFQADMAKLNLSLKKGIQVNELMTMLKEGEFPTFKSHKQQASLLDVVYRLESATVSKVLIKEAADRSDRNIGIKTVLKAIECGDESMEEFIMDVSREFGPSSEPVKEIAAVGHMLNEGVRCDEVITLIDAGLLPALQQPALQVPLISLVVDKGNIKTVCEVLVSESTKELQKDVVKIKSARTTEVKDILKKAKAESVNVKTFTPEMVPGVQAYVKMAKVENVNIEELVKKIDVEEKLKLEIAKMGQLVKHGVMAEEVLTLMEAGEFPQLMKRDAQAKLLNVVEEFGFKALVNEVIVDQAIQQKSHSVGVKAFVRMVQEANVNVEKLLTEKCNKEFWAEKAEPLQEIAKISAMMKEGVQAEEIISMIETGHLPALAQPDCQIPLLKLVEEEGHSAITCEVLIEESVKSVIQELPSVSQAKISSQQQISEMATVSEVVIRDLVAPPSNVKQGDQLRAVATYVAEEEHESAMHLVEGERIYVQEWSNNDWWFVEKHLTKERGYVPAKLLAEETVYATYVQQKLEEKIYKLPVFDKLKKGQKSEPPKVLMKLEPQVVLDGQEAQFICKVEGVPRPNITWFRQTAIIKPSDEFQTFYSEDNTATLIIKEVFPEDAGMFTCVAKNQAGVAACGAELVVEGPISDHGSESLHASRRSLSRESSVCDILEGIPPTFAQKASDKQFEEGSQVEMDVRLVAIPEPEIIWRKDGQQLKDSNRLRIVRQKDVHAYRSIIIIKGAKKEDEGVYEIYAKNREGEARNIINVTITAPEAPHFDQKFQETTVEDEGTIRLVARISGVPAPDVTWSRGGKKLKAEKNIVISFQDGLAVLEIQKVSPKVDSGKYVCSATNKVGKATHSATVTVGVDVVTFKRGLESCVVDETSEIVLECRTSKEKKCKWYKGKTELKTDERILIEQEGLTQRLIVHSAVVADTGKYKCIFDSVSTTCTLTVKGTDEFVERIQDVEVQEKESAAFQAEVSSDSATVCWFRDGEEITSTNTRYKLECEGVYRRLTLISVTLSDEGEYACALGDVECTAELGVSELPAEIVRKMSDQTVTKNSRASFEVELTKGDAVVAFFKDDQELRFSDHYQLSIDGKVQRLLVYNCQLEDAGIYKAVVGRMECSATLKVEGSDEGEFTKKLPGSMDVNFNTSAEFTVEVNKAEHEVTWFRQSEQITSSEKYVIESEGCRRTLIVKNVSQIDAVEYTCVLNTIKTSCKLNVVVLHTAPQVEKDMKADYVVNNGHEVTFTVPFRATPPPTVEWYFKGQLINTDGSGKYRAEIDETCAWLKIGQVEGGVCGDYTCKIKNDCGDVTASFTLKLLDKPSKPGKPEALSVTNESVSLHWIVPEEDGGREIFNYIIEYRTNQTETWTVFNVEEQIKSNTYNVTTLTMNEEYTFRVTAVNDVGKSDCSDVSEFYKVCVPVKPEPPVVKEPLKGLVTTLHQSITLRCVITGTPEPTVTWLKDEQVNMANTKYENYEASFTIKETAGSSAGTYTCRATNEAGMAESTATVVIQESVRFEFDEKQQCQRLLVGEKYHVPIKVTGYPQPKITWGTNDGPIQSATRVVVHTEEQEGLTDIAIQKVTLEDSAVFTLTAENEAGRGTICFNLRVIEVPAPPTGPLEISEVKKESVKLSWKASSFDGGMNITSYYIEKLEKGQENWQKVEEVGANIETYVVQNLIEGREYFFRVFAVNPLGLSQSLDTQSTIVIKCEFDVPGPPIGPFDINTLTDSTLLLHWDEPETDGGSPILGYILERRETSKKAWQKVGQTPADVTQMEISGLKKGVQYHFRVYAFNDAGQGPPLQPEEPITAAPPAPPQSLQVIDVTSRTVSLAWSPPTTTGGADLIGYVIERRLTSEKKWERVDTVDSSVTLYCVENLKEKSEYEFRVYAENPVGLSEEASYTEKVQLKTHASPPSPPTAPLEARPTGPTSLMIEWGMPESDGGSPLIGYIIAIRDVKRTMWIEVGQVDANFTRLHIKELQEEHEYHVRVFARNEVGTSDPLETDEAVKIIRPDDFQELPQDDAAPSLSYSTTETLSWMREAGVDADIYSYARGRLLNRDEYFFKVWHQTQKKRKSE